MNITQNNRKTLAALVCAITGFFALNLRAETAWTTGSCAPGDWTALPDNVLLDVSGTTTSDGVPGYASGNVAVLTDGNVPTTSPDKGGIFGFRNSETVSWTFAAPKTIDQIRISTCYLGGAAYDGVHVAKVEAMFYGGSTWQQIAGDCEYKGESAAGKINYIVLDNGNDPVAQNIVGLKVTFGSCETGYANYYAEIEAVGSAGVLGPALGAFAIIPAKTKAMISGSIADPGTDATACDVYLALDGGPATKIAAGVTGSFEYQLRGLTAETEYAYELSVSNNAATARGTVRSGEFTTLAADAQTASWTQGEYAPADWTPLANNILGNLVATEKTGVSFAASQDMAKLTDGSVPNPAAGAETVGFTPSGAIAWRFEAPMTIEKLRLSSLWETTFYNGISVNAVQVMYKGSAEWVALDVPTVQWTGGTQLGQTETLSDPETGILAQNAVGLKVFFGPQKAAIANYYAEIEAVGHLSRPPTVISLR